jgi:hypothetical protein
MSVRAVPAGREKALPCVKGLLSAANLAGRLETITKTLHPDHYSGMPNT